MARKKRHWTQTPAGKAKMRENAAKRHAAKTQSHGVTNERTEATHVAYIFGKVETLIEYYARSNGVPVAALAAGVASLLSHSQSR